jgi:septum formation protein
VELVLASASPRRRELLEAAGLRFTVLPASIDEDAVTAPTPEALARLLAEGKARAAAGARAGGAPAVVLGADTVVALASGRLLGKPRDRAEAGEHLRALSGTTHRVVTGVCLLGPGPGEAEVFHAVSRVTMRALGEDEIRAYADGGEGMDKAGGYALQAGADRFVTGVEGSRSNVVGLPVEDLLPRLAARGVRP